MTKTPAYNADWLGNQYSFSFFLSHFLSLPLSLYFSLSFFSSPQEHSALTFGNLCGAKQEKIQTIMTVCCLSPDFCWLLFVFGFLVCVCVCVCEFVCVCVCLCVSVCLCVCVSLQHVRSEQQAPGH